MNFGTSFYVFLSFLAIKVQSIDEETSLWRKSFRPPHFTQPSYKATVLSNNSIEIMDGPIKIENVSSEMYFVISSDNYEDYAIHESDNSDQNEILLGLTSTEPINREYDIVIIEALNEDQEPVARSMVLVFNSVNESNMYKMKFKIDDSEYIVLNYYYFKWFLALLTITGLMILLIESQEIIRNLRMAERKKNEVKYSQLFTV